MRKKCRAHQLVWFRLGKKARSTFIFYLKVHFAKHLLFHLVYEVFVFKNSKKKTWMGLFANRMELYGPLFIGKQMHLGMFLSLAGKKIMR